MKKQRAAVAFSGGKDSTAATILLKEKGYDVVALTMVLGLPDEAAKISRIENLAGTLGIPLKTVDLRAAFKEKVIDYFTRSYAAGNTPNPCVVCNYEIKFNLLLDYALKQAACDFFATGHYADKVQISGNYFLKEPVEKQKSQIYFLSLIGKERLKQVVFPLAGSRIAEVREMVKDLPLANRQESQDACFLQDVNLMDYLRDALPGKFKPGVILDIDGNEIGTHQGAIYFTVGQRRGTRFSSDRKLYVVKTDAQGNTITLGEDKHLFSDFITVTSPVFWKEVKPGEVYKVRVRYFGNFTEAEIESAAPDRISARFKKPVRAVTPGQIGVFYQDEIIVAAGFIE
ncbi:MAG: tRNA 2-thiouridine(34) synthase MnmA [Candidatus Aminicenantes bacterium]|nr:tRNA 2-thiouridine(34) synthase MnmA [Candidatus Aminicenantes bacterium]